MKASEWKATRAPSDKPEELEEPLPYPRSELAEPPISDAEARAVDLGRDTCICRWHRGGFAHLNQEGQVLFCPIGGQLWRYTKQLSAFMKPLR